MLMQWQVSGQILNNMIYIRKIFNQDLRDGKQIAFPKEPSNAFFHFNFSNPDGDKQISFKFKEKDETTVNFSLNNHIINTRLYSAGSESRIDGQLKQFLRDKLKASVDDIIIFTYISDVLFEFEFIPQVSKFYASYKEILKNKNHEVGLLQDDKNGLINNFTEINITNFSFSQFIDDLQSSGLSYSTQLISRFTSSLLTKPFVILTGLSGSGKTKLAQAFAMWLSADKSQYKIVPVGADWTNREPLLGFPNALQPETYVKPDSGVLDLIIAAKANPEKPYFLILDEMNLSHVERYFADFLSTMESDEELLLHAGDENWGDVPAKIKLHKNLFIIGTVNIDETTYMFSPKVLDRANVIEFRVTGKEMFDYLSQSGQLKLDNLKGKGAGMEQSFVQIAANKEISYSKHAEMTETLVSFFEQLKVAGAEFGYRTASEIKRFAAVTEQLETGWITAQILDAAIMQKLLPKLHGSRRKLEPVLKTLISLCIAKGEKPEDYIAQTHETDSAKVLYPVSLEKIQRMYRGLIDNGFTSYAEA